MKQHKNWNDISEYFDGESKNPQKIERALEADPEAKKSFEAIGALSHTLKSLPEPELSYSLAPRVIATLKSIAPRHIPWGYRIGAPLATMACLALIIAVSTISITQQNTPFQMTVNTPVNIATQDPTDEIDTPYAAAADTSWMFSDRFRQAKKVEPQEQESIYLNLTSIDWFDTTPYTRHNDFSDIQSAVNEMDQRETEVLLILLSDYAREGNSL